MGNGGGEAMALEPVAPLNPPDDGLDQARLLAEVASVVHGRVPLEDKLAWVTGAAAEVTGATVGAYVSVVMSQVRVECVTGDSAHGDVAHGDIAHGDIAALATVTG